MRPTFSIIVFTVLSGTGYGLWFVLGLGLVGWWPRCGEAVSSGETPIDLCVYPGIIPAALTVGFVLVAIGLLSSVAHLGKPARAWRALSQWRSSWLSREGIAALLTFVPALAIAASIILPRLRMDGRTAGAIDAWLDPRLAWPMLGAALALGSLATVVCTANIYASLKPIRAWRNRFVVPGYLLFGLQAGALAMCALATLPAAMSEHEVPALLAAIAVLATAGATLKVFYWRDIDREPGLDAGHATSLDALGTVRSFEQPHTEENYLTHEMGFVLARRHAAKLRRVALIAAFALPAALAVLGIALPVLRVVAAWLALASGLAGIFLERWLFFAEAKHAVIAYYGR